MKFTASAQAYDRFMGRYSTPLAPQLADFAGVGSGQRVIDVGCGPGALTAELVRRVDAANVAAVDPSEAFVEAVAERYPGVDARVAPAERLPFADGAFDAALAQLVVHFMSDPIAGLREMSRVSRVGGMVAACVWDHAGSSGPLATFWSAAREFDPNVDDESKRAGTREGHLAELFAQAGLRKVESAVFSIAVEHPSFDAWWEPYTLAVGPAGVFVASLDEERRTALRERCRELLPPSPFTIHARAWAARGST